MREETAEFNRTIQELRFDPVTIGQSLGLIWSSGKLHVGLLLLKGDS